MMRKLNPYLKAVVSVIFNGIIAIITTGNADLSSYHTWVPLIVSVLGTLAVFLTPNVPAGS